MGYIPIFLALRPDAVDLWRDLSPSTVFFLWTESFLSVISLFLWTSPTAMNLPRSPEVDVGRSFDSGVSKCSLTSRHGSHSNHFFPCWLLCSWCQTLHYATLVNVCLHFPFGQTMLITSSSKKQSLLTIYIAYIKQYSWLGGSVVERRSLTGELSLVCTGPASDG